MPCLVKTCGLYLIFSTIFAVPFWNRKLEVQIVFGTATMRNQSAIDKADTFGLILNMDSKMTLEEAKAILQNSKEMSPFTNEQGITWYYQLGEYSKVLVDGNFAFVVYPHSKENPIDPSRAYMYFVSKDSGKVGRDTVHMCDRDFEYMGAKK